MRCGLEVFARLTNLFSEKSAPFSWSHDQLKELCKSWESAVLTASNFSCIDERLSDEV